MKTQRKKKRKPAMLPKPVEAWAPVDNIGLWMATIVKEEALANLDPGCALIRVRIVPIRGGRRG